MAKVHNTFTNGRMESDAHQTYADNKGYSYALNLRPSGYGNDGAMSAIRGSELVADYSEDGTMTVVGMYSGEGNKLYSFLARRDGLSKIIEIDIETKQSRVVIEDAEHLRFDLLRWRDCQLVEEKYLLSINQIDNFLYFSNEVWEYPRVIDITKEYIDFELDDILLAKKPPKYAPNWEVLEINDIENNQTSNKFIQFAYRYKYIDNNYSSFSFYSDIAFLPKSHIDINHDNENMSMINILSKVRVVINTGNEKIVGIEVIAREMLSDTAYIIGSIDKRNDFVNGVRVKDNEEIYIEYSFLNNYAIADENIVGLNYSNTPKFPKSQDIVGERLFYANYKEGFDLVDKNGNPINISYEKRLMSIPEGNGVVNRRTLISDFNYKLGVVYYNDFNESTTVLLENNLSETDFYIRKLDRSSVNFLRIKLKHRPPSWATKFKFVAMYPKLNYNNINTTEIIREDGYVKVLIKNSNINKVKAGDWIMHYSDNATNAGKHYVEKIEVKNGKNYAVINDDDTIKSIDNVTSKTVRTVVDIESERIHYAATKVNHLKKTIIDFNFGTLNLDRYVSNSGYQGTPTLNYNGLLFKMRYNSISNRGAISKQLASEIKKNQYIDIKINFLYRFNKSFNDRSFMGWVGLRATTIMGNWTFKKKVYADKDYLSLFDFLSSCFRDDFFTLTQDNDYVYLGTTAKIVDKLKVILRDYDVILRDNGREKDFITVEVDTVATLYSDSLNEVFRTENKDIQNTYYYESPITYDIENGEHMGADIDGFWDAGLYNGYCWGNGVESYKIKDDFNGKKLEWSFRPNAVDPKGYGCVHRKNDITYSGLYNKDYKINNLNMFIPSTVNWRELPSEYGQIQRIVSNDGDITVFCDDKLITVFYGKTLISDLQGSENIATTKDILGGHAIYPYNFGCQHPESISQSVDGIYFTDKKRKRYLFMSNKQMYELNPEGSGHHYDGVNEIRGSNNFVSYYDEGYGEWVAGLGGSKSVIFNPQAKGFSHYNDYSFEYIHGMSGRRFTAYQGKIYEDEVRTDVYNIFAGGQEREAKLRYIINSEFSVDKVFKAMMLQSNVAWNTEIRTNLVGTKFTESAFTKKESFFYTHIYRDTETPQNSRGIGVIQKTISMNKFEFSRAIDIDIACGDTLKNENGTGSSVITDIVENTITVENGAGFSVGDYVFARKQTLNGYTPDGAPMRGKWLEATLSKKYHEPFSITSTSTEIIESKF